MTVYEALRKNPMKTREDAAESLLTLIRPLRPFYSPGHAWLRIGYTGVHYGEKAAAMEGACRILWGLGPLWSQNNSGLSDSARQEIEEWYRWYLEGIINGTDPSGEEYWGDLGDYDQLMVEMAALAVTVALSPERFWEPLTEGQKQNLVSWMSRINRRRVHANNWRFFRILTNMTLMLLDQRSRGSSVFGEENRRLLSEDWEVIEQCFLGDGWYFDGNPGQMDYYIPFAMHFYGLLYAKLADEGRAAILKERAVLFAKDFIYWFANDGQEVPFGRSLTYRFAHQAFWGAYVYSGAYGTEAALSDAAAPALGAVKHIILENFRNWFSRPITDAAGILTIGYGYPNLLMSESYNAPGSPYWALKSYLILGLDETHPFWQVKEEEYAYEETHRIPRANMLAVHQPGNQVFLYPVGQHCMNFGCCEAKYEKFVYSNRFAFSVSRGSSLEAGAFDSTLAVSPAGEEAYRSRYGFEAFTVNEEGYQVSYHLGSRVRVTSTIISRGLSHKRIHEIQTEEAIDVADCGFAIAAEPPFTVVRGRESDGFDRSGIRTDQTQAAAEFPWGTSRIRTESGGIPQVICALPNTNLLYNRTVIPAITWRLAPGSYRLVTEVFGEERQAAKNK